MSSTTGTAGTADPEPEGAAASPSAQQGAAGSTHPDHGHLGEDSPAHRAAPRRQSPNPLDGTEDPLAGIVNIRELEAAARAVLDPARHDYFAGGAQDEITVRANESAFGGITLVPRMLRGFRAPRLDFSLLGAEMTMPVLLAPTAFHKLAHPEAERATARAAAGAGVTMIAAMLSTVAIEDIAAEARKTAAELGHDRDPCLWFQLYVQPDLAFTEAIVRRAEEAGCQALVVTVDSPALGRRERDDRNDFHDLPPGMRCENLRDLSTGDGKRGDGHVRQVVLSPEISWRHIEWLREVTDLPILLKGVLHPQDAAQAAHHGGVDGLIVSNHGGRQLDTAPATIDQLPWIVDAVQGRVPLLLDGGIRRGTDVIKALALGATAVAIGRPAIWGLALAGEQGVAKVLELLRNELENALALCGCDSPQTVSRDLIGPGVDVTADRSSSPARAAPQNALGSNSVRQ